MSYLKSQKCFISKSVPGALTSAVPASDRPITAELSESCRGPETVGEETEQAVKLQFKLTKRESQLRDGQ